MKFVTFRLLVVQERRRSPYPHCTIIWSASHHGWDLHVPAHTVYSTCVSRQLCYWQFTSFMPNVNFVICKRYFVKIHMEALRFIPSCNQATKFRKYFKLLLSKFNSQKVSTRFLLTPHLHDTFESASRIGHGMILANQGNLSRACFCYQCIWNQEMWFGRWKETSHFTLDEVTIPLFSRHL